MAANNEEECQVSLGTGAGGLQAKVKALQQLAVSQDSPFNLSSPGESRPNQQSSVSTDSQTDSMIALQLRRETDEIKRQLELVKRHLASYQQAGGLANLPNNPTDCCNASQAGSCDVVHCGPGNKGHPNGSKDDCNHEPEEERRCARRQVQHCANHQQITSADSQFYRQPDESQPNTQSAEVQQQCQTGAKSAQDDAPEVRASDKEATRFRPLTGKTDCPNCACDRRRSVCDTCMNLQKEVVHQASDQQHPLESSSMPLGPPDTSPRQPSLLTDQKISKLNDCATAALTAKHQNDERQFLRNYDDRPIKPAKKQLSEMLDEADSGRNAPGTTPTKATVMDQVVVPSKLYAIGRSLNDKRTQLAQAIEDLQSTIDKVKKRGDRLDQERKVAMLYRNQWRFGGSRSGSRESLARAATGGPNYQSRLDPNLARDAKAMMGFKHIEPSLRLRQYEPAGAISRSRSQLQSVPPKPRPRLSKMSGNKPSPFVPSSGGYRRATAASTLHSRSKSLESLPKAPARRQTQKPPVGVSGNARAEANFRSGKASSEMNLASRTAQKSADGNDDSDADQGVEEDIEEEIREDDLDDSLRPDSVQESLGDVGSMATEETRPPQFQRTGSPANVADRGGISARGGADNQPDKQLAGGRWVPVFGETEIKTINRRPLERKVIILNGSTGRDATGSDGSSQGRQQAETFPAAIPRAGRSILRPDPRTLTRPKSATRSGNSTDRVLNEAKKKLQFANNLLERERVDSRVRNQVIVNRHASVPVGLQTRLKPAKATMAPVQSLSRQPSDLRNQCQPRVTSGAIRDKQATGVAQNLILGANREISRLEEMIGEQQRLLLKLTAATSGPVAQPPVCCHAVPPPCRATPSPGGSSAGPHRSPHAGRQLINHLRDRLNKTKARLAKTLEEERTKHQQLEQRFDSTLRKQSDLENENRLLKQSLNKCINTCLRDIMSTFESLSEHLSESAGDIEDYGASPPTVGVSHLSAPSPSDSPSEPPASGDTPFLANAARLIADNSHMKRMKMHIETIEQQRRGMFEELNQEKHKSQQLELELQQSKLELEQLIEARKHLESQLAANARASDLADNGDAPVYPLAAPQEDPTGGNQNNLENKSEPSPEPSTSRLVKDSIGPLSSGDRDLPISENSLTDDPTSLTFSSIDLYRQYIQSMTPDLDAIRRERRMILNEFDNVKRLLSDVNT